uniref:Putative secreted protein n=1 Tax=Rhipicephalus microplus TaxID=6941 RepID=A0A6G5A170_RHIMP
MTQHTTAKVKVLLLRILLMALTASSLTMVVLTSTTRFLVNLKIAQGLCQQNTLLSPQIFFIGRVWASPKFTLTKYPCWAR